MTHALLAYILLAVDHLLVVWDLMLPNEGKSQQTYPKTLKTLKREWIFIANFFVPEI